jgi:TolB-like protein
MFCGTDSTSGHGRNIERSLVRGNHDILPLLDKPSFAVLAFTDMSGDIDQEYFSDGIAEGIITELSRSGSLFVVPSYSVSAPCTQCGIG